MPIRYTLKEPKRRAYVPPRPFGLYGDGLVLHEIVRLILGSVNIYDKATGETLSLKTNELKRAKNRPANPKTIVKSLFGPDFTVSDYEKFVRRASAQNEEFYKTLKSELVLCLVAKHRGRYSESFLYLYRILEYVSVAMPLMYSSVQLNFSSSYVFLKDLVQAENDGHLVILKRVVPHIARQSNIGNVPFKFSVAGRDVAWISAVREQFENRIKDNVQNLEFDDVGDILFSVPFNSVPSLIINVRNRMFHYRLSEGNIDLGNIGGSEWVCAMMMPELVQWFSLLLVEMILIMAKSSPQ